jgi:hypothetical protein
MNERQPSYGDDGHRLHALGLETRSLLLDHEWSSSAPGCPCSTRSRIGWAKYLLQKLAERFFLPTLCTGPSCGLALHWRPGCVGRCAADYAKRSWMYGSWTAFSCSDRANFAGIRSRRQRTLMPTLIAALGIGVHFLVLTIMLKALNTGFTTS